VRLPAAYLSANVSTRYRFTASDEELPVAPTA
jgi:hypothetical protein